LGVISALTLLAAQASAADDLDAAIGKALFERNWVSAPSSTKSDDGLGPLYDAPSCASCHVQRPLADFDETTVPPGTVIRLGNARGGGDPIYGHQLQTRAVAGLEPEANPDITWTPAAGGRWTATIKLYSQHYGPLASQTKMALRRAPVLNGAGLLVKIPESEIVALASAQRAKNEGIAGKPAYLTIDGKRVLGRLGWKAAEPDLAAQASLAFSRDIGLSTKAYPESWGDCTPFEAACRAGPHGAEPGEVEIAPMMVDAIVQYLKTLPPPAPKNGTGESVFDRAGCGACHATLHLADGKPVSAYTDLLLHNLGPALDDGIKEGAADAGEWRTAPLWNVAQSLKIGRLLHDGRARTVEEAIEWHAGEATAARARFRGLNPADRAALVAFVSGL
jgi:CxxC motif-containing protein (DUF1111 family)